LEAKEALETLLGQGPNSVIEKSCQLAGILLELSGVKRGQGEDIAADILKSGKALEKFREIIAIQGGDPNIKPEDIPVGEYTYDLQASIDGYVKRISNDIIKKIDERIIYESGGAPALGLQLARQFIKEETSL
jgi:AMP phosphorylase